jgi:hypothetical protein
MFKTETFIDQCLRGTALPDEIDDYVEKWHDGEIGQDLELRELLGMDRHEYAIWMRDANAIYSIIAAKRNRRPVEDFTEDYFSMPLAARAGNTDDAKKLTDWLRKIGKID